MAEKACYTLAMNYEIELRQRLEANEKEIVKLKERAKELELEQHRLGIALEVIKSFVPAGQPAIGRLALALTESHQSSTQAQVASAAALPGPEKLSVKQLVLREVNSAGFALTKMDVVSRLAATGHTLNSTTVGSTLSKLVEAGVLEKSGHSAYRAKQMAIEGST